MFRTIQGNFVYFFHVVWDRESLYCIYIIFRIFAVPQNPEFKIFSMFLPFSWVLWTFHQIVTLVLCIKHHKWITGITYWSIFKPPIFQKASQKSRTLKKIKKSWFWSIGNIIKYTCIKYKVARIKTDVWKKYTKIKYFHCPEISWVNTLWVTSIG